MVCIGGPENPCNGASREDLDERDGLDAAIAGILLDMHPKPSGEGCPAPAMLASYLDGALDAGEVETVSAHIEKCTDCAHAIESARAGLEGRLSRPSESAREAALVAMKRSREGLFDVAVRLVKDTIRLIGEAVPDGGVMAPAAVRGGAAPSSLVSTTRSMNGLRVGLDIENLGDGTAEVVVTANRKDDGNPVKGLRASMFRSGRELLSVMMADGRAVFEDVEPGAYTINLTARGFCVADIELDIQEEQ